MKKTITRLGLLILTIIVFSFASCEEFLDLLFEPTELTGSISILGNAEVGQILAANTNALGGSGIISYQWMRNEITPIGDDSNTYTVVSADVGSTISVTVTRANNTGFVTSNSILVSAFPGDIREPYFYPGTGRTYNGFLGTEGSHSAYSGNTGGQTIVTYPSELTFSADAFITLEGYVNHSDVFNYAMIVVSKNGEPGMETTYFVHDNFKIRVWLRFGAGEYTVNVRGLSSITFNSEGVHQGASWWGSPVSFNVTNTQAEDGRFIYPSYIIQSDDPMILDLAVQLTSGKTNDRDKIESIHDWIVKNTVYDMSVFAPSPVRKKQDAVSVLSTRYNTDTRYTNGHFLAVCEGYSNVFAAISRAAGFQVRYVSSKEMNHAWNNIFYNGAWKFVDVTWNDPITTSSSHTNIVDFGPGYVRHEYFLLDDLRGKNPHTKGNTTVYDWSHGANDSNEVVGRSLLPVIPTAPWQRDVPAGWY